MPSFAAKLANERPEEVATRDESREMSWAEVDDTLNRVANGLNEFDLGPKRRVAVFAENAVETAMANLGGLIAGASVVPVNFHLTAEEVAYILEDAEVRVMFADARTLDRAITAAQMAGVPKVISWHAEAEGSEAWEAWLAGCSAAPVLGHQLPHHRPPALIGLLGHPRIEIASPQTIPTVHPLNRPWLPRPDAGTPALSPVVALPRTRRPIH